MAIITISSDDDLEEALRYLTEDGADREAAIRQAILDYWRVIKEQASSR